MGKVRGKLVTREMGGVADRLTRRMFLFLVVQVINQHSCGILGYFRIKRLLDNMRMTASCRRHNRISDIRQQ